jgi:hypothetical protein
MLESYRSKKRDRKVSERKAHAPPPGQRTAHLKRNHGYRLSVLERNNEIGLDRVYAYPRPAALWKKLQQGCEATSPSQSGSR